MMNKMTKLVSTLIVIASILFVGWIVLSWIDIVIDNLSMNPQHHPLNFFIKAPNLF